jgi:uncharacterized membrane protein
MADQSTQSIVIDAPPDRIMAVIADFPAYPEWANAVKDIEIVDKGTGERAKQVQFTLEAGPVKDVYVLEYDWAADGLVTRWHLIKGQMQKAQEGCYELRPDGASTNVTYTLSVSLAIPMIGLFKRKAEKVIMDTALRELKRRVESTA